MEMLASASRVHRLHSSCTALMGCTACAARISAGLASLRPRYLTLPSFTNSCTPSRRRGCGTASGNTSNSGSAYQPCTGKQRDAGLLPSQALSELGRSSRGAKSANHWAHCHGLDGLFDGRAPVDAVQVVEIHAVNLQVAVI